MPTEPNSEVRWHSLSPHPGNVPAGELRVEARVSRDNPRRLQLEYRIRGSRGALRLPPVSPPVRADGLWRASCVEAFVRPAAGDEYLEFNFSPGGPWAAYAFDGPRRGMRAFEIREPELQVRRDNQGFELAVNLQLPDSLDAAWDGAWKCALTAVLLDAEGRPGYWSLRHPLGAPDFHDLANYALRLPSPPDAAG